MEWKCVNTHKHTRTHTAEAAVDEDVGREMVYGDMDSSITKCRLNVQLILLEMYCNIVFLWGFFISYEFKTNVNEKDWYFCTK